MKLSVPLSLVFPDSVTCLVQCGSEGPSNSAMTFYTTTSCCHPLIGQGLAKNPADCNLGIESEVGVEVGMGSWVSVQWDSEGQKPHTGASCYPRGFFWFVGSITGFYYLPQAGQEHAGLLAFLLPQPPTCQDYKAQDYRCEPSHLTSPQDISRAGSLLYFLLKAPFLTPHFFLLRLLVYQELHLKPFRLGILCTWL